MIILEMIDEFRYLNEGRRPIDVIKDVVTAIILFILMWTIIILSIIAFG